MTLDIIIVIVLSLVIGALLGTLLAVTRMYNKQLIEMTKALMAKSLTDYTVNTSPKVEEIEQEEPDAIPTEDMTAEQFEHSIKEIVNG